MEGTALKDYCAPTDFTDEDLEIEIQKAKEKSEKLTEWPEID